MRHFKFDFHVFNSASNDVCRIIFSTCIPIEMINTFIIEPAGPSAAEIFGHVAFSVLRKTAEIKWANRRKTVGKIRIIENASDSHPYK